MSRSIGTTLPDEILTLTDGSDLDGRVGITFTLLAEDEDGWPTIALLSVGEVLTTDPHTVRLGLWPGSAMSASIARTGRATLMVVETDVWYVRLRVRQGTQLRAEGVNRAYFECAVEDVLNDAVSYATMTGGMRFRLSDQPTTMRRWHEAIELLKAAPPVPEDEGTSTD